MDARLLPIAAHHLKEALLMAGPSLGIVYPAAKYGNESNGWSLLVKKLQAKLQFLELKWCHFIFLAGTRCVKRKVISI